VRETAQEGEFHPPSQPQAPAAPRASQSRRILIVDDNVDSTLSMAMMLRLFGNSTATAHDGLEALEVAERFRPEVILLDLGMPRLNGYDVARRLRGEAWAEDVLLIALTGWGQEHERRKTMEAGFDHHLVKPVDVEVLKRLLTG
jgi:CheY-like chemotaxis protein